MLSVEEYLDKVLALADLVPSSADPIGGGFGRILAEDLFARYPVPPFTNSAMDGFAVRAADLGIGPTRLEVVGDIPAGAQDAPPVGAGEAVVLYPRFEYDDFLRSLRSVSSASKG